MSQVRLEAGKMTSCSADRIKESHQRENRYKRVRCERAQKLGDPIVSSGERKVGSY